MVQVGTAGIGVLDIVCLALAPNMLAFHAGTTIALGVLHLTHQLIAVEQKIVAAAVDGVGVVPIIGK